MDTDIDSELSSLNLKLAVEIESDAKQIAFLEKRIEKNRELLAVIRGRLGAANPTIKATGYGAKSENVRNAISHITKARFTMNDVEEELKRTNPNMHINRHRLRTILWTLDSKGDTIKKVTEGTNRQPAEFQKLSGETNGSACPPRPTHMAAASRKVISE